MRVNPQPRDAKIAYPFKAVVFKTSDSKTPPLLLADSNDATQWTISANRHSTHITHILLQRPVFHDNV